MDSAPRAVCATCHNFSQVAAPPPTNCTTCHQQHGRSRDLIALVAIAGGRGCEASACCLGTAG